MELRIPELPQNCHANDAKKWLEMVVGIVGPCFHVDTPPAEYQHNDGSALFTAPECDRVGAGIARASNVLGEEGLAESCLYFVYRELGVRFDVSRNELVSI